jgi:hypothetical protein
MKLLYAFGQFIISEWIWSVTFGQHHAAIAIVLMIIAFLYMRIPFVRAVLFAFGAQLFAWIMLGGSALVMAHQIFGVTYDQAEPSTVLHALAASFLLGVIYILFEMLFFYMVRAWLPRSYEQMVKAAAICNLIAAFVVYLLLPPM